MSFLMRLLGHDIEVSRLQASLQEKRPLPVGMADFHAWSERIIHGAMLAATVDSQKYTLANVLVNSCGPAVAFESDAYFINYLRKAAVNQVAVAVRDEIFNKRKAEQNQAAASADPVVVDGAKVLENR